MKDFKQIIIDAYEEIKSNGTSYKSFFIERAQDYKWDYSVEFDVFSLRSKRAINKMRQSIEKYCNQEREELNKRIRYWENFIEDDVAWKQRVESLGGTVNYYDLKAHQEEKKIDRQAKIAELEKEKERWKYENNGFIYERISCWRNKEIPYDELLEMNQAIDEVMKEEKPKERENIAPNYSDLENYFKPAFRGLGAHNFNYFSYFVEGLEELKKANATAKDFAQIALMCYKSEQMNDRRPRTFTKWYKRFCELTGCKHIPSYSKDKLTNISEKLKNRFNYLD